jgi:hypothetical protein
MVKVTLRLALAALLASGLALGAAPAARADAVAKNLKILPKDITKPELKKIMKGIAKALGVECDHCHNTDDYAEDSKNKEIARAMMKMSMEINQAYFKGERKVGCLTCHDGQKEPKKL